MVHIPRDVKHPGLKIAFPTEEVPVLQDPEKNILNQVFA
jgi:hypothetical protein